jgi:hypothetical protein
MTRAPGPAPAARLTGAERGLTMTIIAVVPGVRPGRFSPVSTNRSTTP